MQHVSEIWQGTRMNGFKGKHRATKAHSPVLHGKGTQKKGRSLQGRKSTTYYKTDSQEIKK